LEIKIPSVFDFLDYRKFLQEYRIARSAVDKSFTHYYICFRLGMKNSRSYFNNITTGRKNIGQEIIEKLISLLELSPDEANYFRTLVNYNQSEHPDQKESYFDLLVKQNNTPKKIIPEDCYEYFKTWYHPVIREILEGFTVKNNLAELASKLIPPITEIEAKESIHLLERLNLIKKNEAGEYRIVEKLVVTEPSVQMKLVEQFQLRSMERARERIAKRPKEHKTSTQTIAVSPQGLKRIIAQIDQLKTATRSIALEDQDDEKKVFELIVHLSKQSN
jgi:uncharacterized protein (TIGR02147 family)